ncbi:Ribosome biogenesis protein brx1 [Spiromyces aspiralis]|uniref:Ribosome biogenesis protein brx1 n=1 Tax=Spiromyces aspiralis TaxID=68401 RepID=A0ACC1HTF3_9FUNG|nr:Ribosome biogenesis protein brx1 [Spiromyces aspiralis]
MATVFKAKSNSGRSNKGDTPKTEPIRNRQRVLILSSRGVSSRHRHLMNDIQAMLPHSKKDSKLDTKSNLDLLNELAELNNCNNILFFEARRHEDLYLWMSRAPNGPSVKFHVQNVHTMDELKLTGNCLKGSRPILSFDANFDEKAHLRLLKEMFTQTFGVSRGARRSKPFFDHVLSFTVADNRIWIRNFQIIENGAAKVVIDEEDKSGMSLVEIGPRFVLNPIRIFEGSFGGPTVYQNPDFISPSTVRAAINANRAMRYNTRADAQLLRKEKLRGAKLPEDPLNKVFE